MTFLKIQDAPLKTSIVGDEKIPTGGYGDLTVTVQQIKDFTALAFSNVDNTADLDKPISTATQAALDLKANITYVDSSLSLKSDKTYVDEQLALKASKIYVDTELQKTASKTYVDSQLVSKATNTYVDSINATKASISYVDSELALKSDITYVDTSLANKTHNSLVGRDVANAHPASAILDASGKTQQQINNGLESIADMLAIANPQTGMRVHVNSYNAPNYALAKPHYGGGTFIYDASKSTVNDDGLVLNGWVRQNYSVLKPEFWGADPHNQVDCSAAFNKMFIAAKGLSVELDGHYKFTSPIVVDYVNAGSLKMYGQGSGLFDTGNGTQRTVLDFDALPTDSTAITFKRIRGLYLSDFHITHSTAFSDFSVTMWVTTLDMFNIEGITIKNTNGVGSTAIQFGKTDGYDCAFMGTVKNVEINMQGGRATSIMPACTTINHINCYQQGGYFYSYQSQYCMYKNCASEGSPSYGYIAEDTKSMTYYSCAGEANYLGSFTVLRGCSNIEYISPYGAANRGIYGALININGTYGPNFNIKISNPVSLVNPYAQYDIYSDGVNGIVEVSNVYAPNLSKNIGGSAAWKEACLMVTGDLVVDDSFTATPNGFIAATPPTVTGAYSRAGNTVEILIKVTPTASTTTDANTTITIPTFGGIRLDSVGTVVSQNNTSRGNCFVSASGVIQMPVISSGTTSPLYIRATLITTHTPS